MDAFITDTYFDPTICAQARALVKKLDSQEFDFDDDGPAYVELRPHFEACPACREELHTSHVFSLLVTQNLFKMPATDPRINHIH